MANYAVSSQRLHWSFSQDDLDRFRTLDHKYMSHDEYKGIQIYLYDLVHLLAAKLGMRQQATATAMVYLLRFYTRAAFLETNIYMIAAAAVYLACKIEECPHHIKTVTTEIQTLWGLGKVSSESQKLAEAEFYLINELDTYLVVHHPYRILSDFLHSHAAAQWQRVVDVAWIIVNESYYTDIPLTFEPDVIAYTALRLAYSHKDQVVKDNGMEKELWHPKLKRNDLISCTKAFLEFWRFRAARDTNAKPEITLKRGRDELGKVESGAAESEAKTKKYKEKIQAMQKK